MGYTSPSTRVTGELITAAIWNADVTDNLNYLLTRPTAAATLTSDITTTSSTFVDMTGASVTLTLASTQALLMFDAVMQAWPDSNSANTFELKVVANGVDVKTRIFPGKGSMAEATLMGLKGQISFTQLITGLTPGSNTIKLQWRHGTSPTGTVKLYGASGAYLAALEA